MSTGESFESNPVANGRRAAGWMRFLLLYFICALSFGLLGDLTSPPPSWSIFNASIGKVILATVTGYMFMHLLPFVVGMIASLAMSLTERGAAAKSMLQRAVRALWVSVPVAAAIVYVEWYAHSRLGGLNAGAL